MAAKKSIQILDQAQIKQKIDRIAYQILEDCFDEKEIIDLTNSLLQQEQEFLEQFNPGI